MIKWINEMGIYFPTEGNVTFLDNPGLGVFQIATSPNPMDKRLGLRKVSDKFEFDFKIYDVGCEEIGERIKTVWNSDCYKKTNKNLGVIFNGIKGTGKTVKSKLLCNEIGIPVILVDNDYEGQILPFITNLNFECIVFLDEAEKTFSEDPEILLKLIDGAYNVTRKLYLLTTNNLTIDDNLIDRPGRIRYIQEFGNLSAKAISECIDDNLENPEYKDLIIKLVDRLEFSTVDILKNIIEEVNILGPSSIETKVDELNIPIASYTYDCVAFRGPTCDNPKELIKTILDLAEELKGKSRDPKIQSLTPQGYLTEYVENSGEWNFGYDIVSEVPEIKNMIKWTSNFEFRSSYPELKQGLDTNNGKVLEVFDEFPGFFMYAMTESDPYLCLLLDKHKPRSLYSVL